jgi:glycosyltransferase 2 family protein
MTDRERSAHELDSFRSRVRSFLVLAARISISALLLYFALRGIDFAALQLRLGRSSGASIAGWMTLAILTNLVQVVVGAARWREISLRCDAPLRLSLASRFCIIGTFFNQTLPSTIGGDAVKLWLLGKTGAGWRAASYSILVDRAVGLMSLAIIVVFSLPWSYQLITDTQGRLALVLIGLAAISAGSGFLLLGAIPDAWLQKWWPTRHIHACSLIANRTIFDRHSGSRVALLSFTTQFLTVVTAWCAVRAITAPASFEQVFFLIPPIVLITMLPISIAGWGVREAAMIVVFGYAGLTQADGLMVSVLFGASYFIVGAIGGLVWILGTERLSRMPAVSAG